MSTKKTKTTSRGVEIQGLTQNTLQAIVRDLVMKFPRKPYDPSSTLPEVMHCEGQQSVIRYLETKLQDAQKYG
jgi:hypothetical protein